MSDQNLIELKYDCIKNLKVWKVQGTQSKIKGNVFIRDSKMNKYYIMKVLQRKKSDTTVQ